MKSQLTFFSYQTSKYVSKNFILIDKEDKQVKNLTHHS